MRLFLSIVGVEQLAMFCRRIFLIARDSINAYAGSDCALAIATIANCCHGYKVERIAIDSEIA